MAEVVIEQAGTEVVRSGAQGRAKRGERGMTTAEYAVGTVAACGFAGVLVKVLTDPIVKEWLWELIKFLIEQFFKVKF